MSSPFFFSVEAGTNREREGRTKKAHTQKKKESNKKGKRKKRNAKGKTGEKKEHKKEGRIKKAAQKKQNPGKLYIKRGRRGEGEGPVRCAVCRFFFISCCFVVELIPSWTLVLSCLDTEKEETANANANAIIGTEKQKTGRYESSHSHFFLSIYSFSLFRLLPPPFLSPARPFLSECAMYCTTELYSAL